MTAELRRGTTLVIVLGIASMLLVLALASFARMRSDGEESHLVLRDAQARVMLTAACQYLQETSRIGWGDPDGDDRDTECFGWTDLRDGSIGPRGPRGDDGKLPVPSWWTASRYPEDVDGDPSDPFEYQEDDLPGRGSRRWPCPGSSMRGECFVPLRTPYAVRPMYAGNPVFAPEGTDKNDWGAAVRFANANGVGMYDPQPVSDDWAAFKAGDREARPSTTNLAWFRCYRELPSDHDADGTPWYDRVPLTGHGAFILACGAGGSLGYRFWDASDPGYHRDLEPETASESGRFADRAMFDELRGGERVLWYRVEWTGFSGGGLNVNDHYRNRDQITGTFTHTGTANNPSHGSADASWASQLLPVANQVPSYFGAMKWIQRLERDPIAW